MSEENNKGRKAAAAAVLIQSLRENIEAKREEIESLRKRVKFLSQYSQEAIVMCGLARDHVAYVDKRNFHEAVKLGEAINAQSAKMNIMFNEFSTEAALRSPADHSEET